MERAPIGIPLNTRILAALFVVGACGAAALAQSDVPFRCHEAAPEQSDRAGSIVIDGVSFADGDRVPIGARGAVEAALKDLRVADEVGWVDEVEEVNVRGALQDAGYFEATAHVRAKFLGGPREERHFSVTVHIDGASWEQFRLMKIRFVAAKAGAALLLPENELRGKFEIGDGDLFDVAKIRRGIENLTRAYGARGYIDFAATPDFEIDHKRHTILLTLTLDQQKQYRIASLGVLGLSPSAEGTLRQRIVPGEIFDSASVESTLEDVYDANKAVLAAIPRYQFSVVARDVKNGTVALTADFRSCPGDIVSGVVQGASNRAHAVRDTGSMKVTVVDAQGAAIPHAEIRVSSEPETEVETDSFGAVSTEGLAPGKYRVAVKARGFKDGAVPDVIITADREQEVRVTLKQAPPSPSDIQTYPTLDSGDFSKFLKAVQEPDLCIAPIPEHVHSYRFLWMPTFDNPIFVHVIIEPDGTATLQVKTLSGAGGYALGGLRSNSTRKLSLDEENTLFSTLADIGFWELPVRISNPYKIILDGTTWAIEGVRDGNCHAIARYSSPLTDIFSKYFLEQVAKVRPYSRAAQ